MKKISFISALFLTACVTINIYFPAAAAEKVADEIIKGIQETPATSEPEAKNEEWKLSVYRAVDGVLNILISPARAAEADLSIETAGIRQLRASMKNRFASLQPFYDSGSIGINKSGLLEIRNAGEIALRDRNKVTKLVAAENADRENLYNAIANANGHPEWYNQIKSTFAKRWVSNATSGWWYQTSGGDWRQK